MINGSEVIRVLRGMSNALDDLEVAKGIRNCMIVAALSNDLNALITAFEKGVNKDGDEHGKTQSGAT